MMAARRTAICCQLAGGEHHRRAPRREQRRHVRSVQRVCGRSCRRPRRARRSTDPPATPPGCPAPLTNPNARPAPLAAAGCTRCARRSSASWRPGGRQQGAPPQGGGGPGGGRGGPSILGANAPAHAAARVRAEGPRRGQRALRDRLQQRLPLRRQHSLARPLPGTRTAI